MFYKIVSIIIIFSFTGCDPGHQITDTIENNSDKKIKIISNAFGQDNQEIIIEPNDKFVSNSGGLGGYNAVNSSEFCPCVAEVTVSITTIDTNFKVIKDFKNPNNWSKTKKKKLNKNGIFTCKFTIEQSDIMPK